MLEDYIIAKNWFSLLKYIKFDILNNIILIDNFRINYIGLILSIIYLYIILNLNNLDNIIYLIKLYII